MTGSDIAPGDEAVGSSDALARDRELFARVAETHPAVIRTLGLLLADLCDLDGLEPELARALGEHLRRVGYTVIRRADRARSE